MATCGGCGELSQGIAFNIGNKDDMSFMLRSCSQDFMKFSRFKDLEKYRDQSALNRGRE